MRFVFLYIFILFFNGCNAQQSADITSLDYSAQTRGFSLEIHMKEGLLNVGLNGEKSEKTLTEPQLKKLNKLTVKIDWEKLKSNLNTEEAAVDRAIPAELKVQINKAYTFQFNHVQLPESINSLINYLVQLSGLEK